MGKCLSCIKPQSISGLCLSDSTGSLKIKPDKQCTVVGDSDQAQTTTPQMMSNFYGYVTANRSNLRLGSADLTELVNRKSSPSVKNKHFSQFFQRKVISSSIKSDRLSLDSKLNALFDKYKDVQEEDMIIMDGVERLCTDLGLQPDDFRILVLAWKFNAEQMCQFTRLEVINGCKAMDVENIFQIRTRLAELVVQLWNDTQLFKNLYRFTFKFGLDCVSGQRILPIDIALCLWKLVFSLHKPPILDKWLLFLQSNQTSIRGIPRDTWNMFLNFSESVGNDLSIYDDTEAWPSIFDDFVEYENDRVNQNVQSDIVSSEIVDFLDEEL